jgi:hypothetical protein
MATDECTIPYECDGKNVCKKYQNKQKCGIMPPNLKVCLLESIFFISIGLYVCFWKVGNVGVGVYLCMFESIHYSESTNTTCPVSLLIFSLAARLSRFGSCRSLSDPERHMKSRDSREMWEY